MQPNATLRMAVCTYVRVLKNPVPYRTSVHALHTVHALYIRTSLDGHSEIGSRDGFEAHPMKATQISTRIKAKIAMPIAMAASLLA
jgi:hypothetical protein